LLEVARRSHKGVVREGRGAEKAVRSKGGLGTRGGINRRTEKEGGSRKGWESGRSVAFHRGGDGKEEWGTT